MQQPKWKQVVERRVVVFRCFVMAEGGLEETEKYLGVSYDYFSCTKDESSRIYLAIKDLKKISGAVIEKIKDDSGFPKQHVNDCLKKCDELVNVSIDSGSLNGKEASEDLKNKFVKYYEVYKSYVKFVVIPVAIEKALTINITKFLEEKAGEVQAEEFLNSLMTPPKLSMTVQEQVDLVVLAQKVKKDNVGDCEPLLDEHCNKYEWLSCYNIDEEAFSKDYFRERLKEHLMFDEEALDKNIKLAKQQLANDEEKYKKIVTDLDISGELLGQIELLREYVFLRSYRIEMQSKSFFNIQPLFSEIAGRNNMSLREAAGLSPAEITAILQGRAAPGSKDIEKRITTYVLISENGKIDLFVGKDGEKIVQKELGKQKTGQVNEIKGVSAYKGQACGAVRVLIKKEEVNKFKQDEILVTTMTSPELVPAMKKAKAIITDEGGVLCHAAIVAREMKKPCVIGTKVATKALKDGDTVEVDADNGIVKIIK